ncbi:MAG: glycosyltransferase family 2 protein [Lachnospiraceae bacterium]|nr:glycosyltransferase family 2 protein [Lachnospiraceae bacterium]
MGLATVDVVIPAYRPDQTTAELLQMLQKQTYPISNILIINTGEENWDESLIRGMHNAEVFHITKAEFDHAAARNMGAGFSNADYLVFMTQDAVPADENLILHLLMHFEDPAVKAVYGRQLPRKDCRIPEGFVRSYNYPPESHVRTLEDLPKYGIKSFFCSNVCAAYDADLFRELHGFSTPAIFNEDMVYAGQLLHRGYSVAYAADAEVYHSHNYSAMQQFHRNFDNGVSQAMHPELFDGLSATGEGKKLVRYVTHHLHRIHRPYLIPGFYWQCLMRFLGFRLGKRYQTLPEGLIRRFSMNPSFWNYHAGDDSLT